MKYIVTDRMFEHFKLGGWTIELMEQHGFIERQVPYKQDFASLPLSKMTPEQVYKAGAENAVDGVTANKAKAWDETCCLLEELRPNWTSAGRTGMEAMRLTLQSMHVQARMPTKEQLIKALEEAVRETNVPYAPLIPNRADIKRIGERAYENLMFGTVQFVVNSNETYDIQTAFFKPSAIYGAKDGP